MRRAAFLLFLVVYPGISLALTDTATFEVRYPQYSYDQQLNSLHEIDFRNFTLIIFGGRGKTNLVAKLRNGIFQRDYPHGCSDWLKLASVKYFDDADAEAQKALVTADWTSACASANDTGVVQVFGIANGRPTVLQQILYNERGGGTALSFNVKTETLTIKGLHGWEHCCPTTLDVGTFKWNGSKFALMKTASIPIPPAN
jgi:hypothetical protein